MAPLDMPPDLVIRPSGVWNSRAPFHNFLREHREQNRLYHLLTASILRLRHEAAQPTNRDRSGRSFFMSRRVGLISERAVLGLRLSLPRCADGSRPTLRCAELVDDFDLALYEVRQNAIVAYTSLFETFVLCWALNLLLARLEGEAGWTNEERLLARLLSPVHTKGPPPGWPKVMKLLPSVAEGLRSLPHIFRHPETDEELSSPLTPSLNAFTVLVFWRDFRNSVVHRGNVVSLEFVRTHGELFEALREPYGAYIGPLRPGNRLLFPDGFFRAVATTHYRSALWLNNELEAASAGRRGHVFAPRPKPESFVLDGTERTPPLLLEGDHQLSLDWVKRFKPTEGEVVSGDA